MIGHWLTQTGTLMRPTLSANSISEQVPTYASAGTFLCRLRPMSGDETDIHNRKSLIGKFRIYTPIMTIYVNDRIVIDSKTYNVLFVSDMMSMGQFLQVDCELVI